MKQFVIFLSMLMLGIAISGMISQFGDSAQEMTDKAISNMDGIVTEKTVTE